MPGATQTVIIVNKKGLHARASNKFVKLANTFKSDISVTNAGERAQGNSIMDLLMLAAHKGCQIEITANGDDAEAAVEALGQLVREGFGELASE